MRDELRLAGIMMCVTACAAERAPAADAGWCPTWRDDVAAALAPCAGCHELDDYLAVLDARDMVAAAIDPARADDVHRPFAAAYATVRAWAACGAPYFVSRIHPGGILNPASDDFHGELVADIGWDLDTCARCHGDGFDGDEGGTCRSCHDERDGPAACDTCHAMPPASGAHPVHVAQWPCETCHEVPARWDAPGHVLGDAPPGEARGFDPATGACTVSCHGADRPRWHGGPDEAPCGSCHGAPPPDHVWDRCAACHPVGATHADGELQVGRTDGCDGCHGSGGEPAPPIDLHGDTFTGARGVGAHRSHVDAPHGISAPVACDACHPVPTTLHAPGHVDTPPPADVHIAVGWDRDTASCATWCHGVARPRWTAVGAGEIACGTCHGVPPPTPAHDAAMTRADCAGCHPATVNAFGGIVVIAGTSDHIDGEVDVD